MLKSSHPQPPLKHAIDARAMVESMAPARNGGGCWRVEHGWPEVHIRRMDQILPPELNAFEFEALRQIAAHPASHHVPSGVRSRLKDIGYVKEVLGGLVLTDDGLQRIAMDK